jgi:ketosteroid isomerase-like protein
VKIISLGIKIREKTPLASSPGGNIVHQYFKFIESKDIQGALDLFDHDAVIYEPFSKSDGLKGRFAIEPFLQVSIMANSDLLRTIEIEKQSNNREPDNVVVALVTFERGDKVQGRFTFKFADSAGSKKIKSLHIEFL